MFGSIYDIRVMQGEMLVLAPVYHIPNVLPHLAASNGREVVPKEGMSCLLRLTTPTSTTAT
jgi:hypothetical protein